MELANDASGKSAKLNRNDLNPSFGVNMDQGSHKWDDVGDDPRKTLVTDMGFMA